MMGDDLLLVVTIYAGDAGDGFMYEEYIVPFAEK